MIRVLVTGAAGQVGADVARALAGRAQVAAYDRASLDLADPGAIAARVREANPTVIVNAGAYTAVDRAETETEAARAVNARAPGVLAAEARRIGALLVHYSTDYVFDGTKPSAYVEADAPAPVNAYGATKLEGERAIAASGCRYVVLRTSWVYSARSANFFLTIRRLAGQRNELRIVDDQHGAPNWSRMLAESTAAILAYGLHRERPTGIYHLSARGRTSWCGFAKAILEMLQIERAVAPIRTDEYPLPARRPANSMLDTGKLERDLGIVLPDWRHCLGLFVAEFLEAREGGQA